MAHDHCIRHFFALLRRNEPLYPAGGSDTFGIFPRIAPFVKKFHSTGFYKEGQGGRLRDPLAPPCKTKNVFFKKRRFVVENRKKRNYFASFGGLVLQGGQGGRVGPLAPPCKTSHRMKFFYEGAIRGKIPKSIRTAGPDKVARSGAAKQNDEYSGHASTRLEEKSEKFHYMNKLEQFIHI